jgi:hypothetical protein
LRQLRLDEAEGCPVAVEVFAGVRLNAQPDLRWGVVGKKLQFPTEFWWRRGELNRPQDSGPATETVLDYPAKSRAFAAFPEHGAGPKKARKVLNNPRKTGPGPVDRK